MSESHSSDHADRMAYAALNGAIVSSFLFPFYLSRDSDVIAVTIAAIVCHDMTTADAPWIEDFTVYDSGQREVAVTADEGEAIMAAAESRLADRLAEADL